MEPLLELCPAGNAGQEVIDLWVHLNDLFENLSFLLEHIGLSSNNLK